MIRQARILIVLAAFGIGVLLGSATTAVVLTKQHASTDAKVHALGMAVKMLGKDLDKVQDAIYETKRVPLKGGFGADGVDNEPATPDGGPPMHHADE